MKRAILFPGQGAHIPKDFNKSYFVEESNIKPQMDIILYELELLEALKMLNIDFHATAGLSLGAFTALYYSGVLTKESLYQLVRQRSQIMYDNRNIDCGMSAIIGLSESDVNEVCKELSVKNNQLVTIANYNAPNHFVISGQIDTLLIAETELKNLGAIIMPLDIEDAYHTRLMSNANDQFISILDSVELNPIQVPYVSNVTGEYVSDIQDLRLLLNEHMVRKVLWSKIIKTMLESGIEEFVEVGPGHTLSTLVKKIESNSKIITVNTPEDLKKII